jgi:hypothetical protein
MEVGMNQQAERTALEARRTGDQTALFWSERGELCCATHAPYPGSDTWNWERWQAMSESDRQAWTQVLKRAPSCEVCHN